MLVSNVIANLRHGLRALSGKGLVLGVLLAHVAPISAQERVQWTVVQPVLASHYRVNVAGLFLEHLGQELGGSVQLHEATRASGAPALAWSLANAPQQRSLVLISEELALIGDAATTSAQHLSHYAPLLMVLETRWCLFVPANSPLLRADQLLDWAKAQSQPPRVAIPVISGRMRLWVQGMVMRTDRAWQMQAYGIGGDVSQALRQGADVALARCDPQWVNHSAMRLLAKGSKSNDGFLSHIPLFTDLGWMPLGHGWLAWFAPKSIPAAERDALAQVLYKIVQKPEVRRQLETTQYFAGPYTPSASAAYVDSFVQTWGRIGHLLLGQDFGKQDKMPHMAVPLKEHAVPP